MKRSFSGILSALLLIASTALAQTPTVDVLYLKNGSVIRGQVINLNARSVRIKTGDGSLFVYKMKEVDKIEKVDAGTATKPDTMLSEQTFVENDAPVEKNGASVQIEEPAPPPKKTGVHFGIRGGLFLNLEIWDQLKSSSYLANDPDSKIGFGLMGVIAPGITIDDDMFLGVGISMSPNFWSQSQKIGGYNTSVSINGLDAGGNLVFGFDDMYLMLGSGSANVSLTATVGGDSKTVEFPDSAPYTRVMVGWGDGVGFAISYVSYSGWATNLSRFEFNLGWSF